MLKKIRTFWVKLKMLPLYSLFEAEFYADVKTGLIFDVWFRSEICDIFESYSYFFNILIKYITYFIPEYRVFVAHRK